MADPNSNVPNYDDPIPTLDEMLMPDGSLGLDYEGLDDQPTAESAMLNEDMNQFGDYHRKGKNIMLDEDINQIGDYHRSGKNVMINEDMNQFEDYHRIGTNIMFNEEMNQFGQGTSQAGTFRVNDQSNAQMPGMFNPEISDCGNPIQIPEWPLPAMPYACSCCQVLREIIHTIVGETKKFEIHGRLGMISHGILEIRRVDMPAPYKEYHMFDFCKESIQRVKMFLEQYCEKQKEAGYTMVKDPLLTFYQAVSVGLNWDLNIDLSDILQGSPVHIGDKEQPNVAQPQAQSQSNEVGSSKRTHKEQMDKIASLTIYDFAEYFHLTQDEASKKVGVSSTICKKICRDAGLKRWPYRKVRKYRKKIAERSKSLNTDNAAERERAEADIEDFRRTLAKCYPPYEKDQVAEDDETDESG
ncbi:putative RWP-RK domain-containing protein [Heracleum sosnowskyi]|uniref:RWP-RK domain-containing protein n=1 Tax=Heracleum sosnowskyi TaxID=360622 RepID=A0AAD8HKJ6_9APIA|nr:putative RWP-RK domain-containing protein [Heracleum sosnowskyi]